MKEIDLKRAKNAESQISRFVNNAGQAFLRTAKKFSRFDPQADVRVKFENGRPKLLRRETVSRCRRILFTGFQLCRRKVRVIWRIWKVLRLQAETGSMLVDDAAFAFVRPIQKIAAIKLQTRLGRHDVHEYA